MEMEHEICARYEPELAAIAALDRSYYLNPSASVDERRDYAARQILLEEIRSRLYAELAACRQQGHQLRRCRSVICRTRHSAR